MFSAKILLEKMSQDIIVLPKVTVMASFANFDAVQETN